MREETMKSTQPLREDVIREFPPLGKYRVRLVAHPKTREKTLDLREYISSETFEGLCAQAHKPSYVATLIM
jgi:hypothetical protein